MRAIDHYVAGEQLTKLAEMAFQNRYSAGGDIDLVRYYQGQAALHFAAAHIGAVMAALPAENFYVGTGVEDLWNLTVMGKAKEEGHEQGTEAGAQ